MEYINFMNYDVNQVDEYWMNAELADAHGNHKEILNNLGKLFSIPDYQPSLEQITCFQRSCKNIFDNLNARWLVCEENEKNGEVWHETEAARIERIQIEEESRLLTNSLLILLDGKLIPTAANEDALLNYLIAKGRSHMFLAKYQKSGAIHAFAAAASLVNFEESNLHHFVHRFVAMEFADYLFKSGQRRRCLRIANKVLQALEATLPENTEARNNWRGKIHEWTTEALSLEGKLYSAEAKYATSRAQLTESANEILAVLQEISDNEAASL